ncbi:cell-division control histidine kinase PdhS [bacterium BMS3Bbin10]|nr:cell-division control histidine kinase PdhS [bacterium BMS3Bbin10]
MWTTAVFRSIQDSSEGCEPLVFDPTGIGSKRQSRLNARRREVCASLRMRGAKRPRFNPPAVAFKSMGRQKKPNGGPAGADHREALDKIARLILVADESGPANESGNEDRQIPDAGPGEGAHPLAGLREPGARRLLEALPAGLAVCEGAELVNANSAFALAFGYASPQALQKAGGIRAIFPKEAGALSGNLLKTPDRSQKPVELQARSNSGREFLIPVAVHAIASKNDDNPILLVLNPHIPAPARPGKDEDKPKSPKAKTNRGSAPAAGEKKRKARGGKQPASNSGSGIERTDFLAKVSHEVRTPLNSIIGFAEIMKEEQLGPIGNERYRGYIRDIHESGLYALSLINDLLDISKIKAGEFELNFTAVDLDEVALECVHSMQPQAQRQRVLLRTSFADDLAPVLADRRSIKQIILNLVSNAIKFTKPGGQVIVSTQATASGGVRIRVRDTGVGMSKGEITLALKPFQQLDTAPRKQTGTGLGLPLTKALVEANRAKFKLRSLSESGTRIDVTFPKSRVARATD